MSVLVLPAGQSLRLIAGRLGVSVEELQQHAGVSDPEAALAIERRIEVPDGFLRGRGKQSKPSAVPTNTDRTGGMNAWLAMDIEQKRTRAGGGMHAQPAGEDEEEGLSEAHRAYRRFASEDNDLAFDLYGQLTVTHSVEVRAQAFAGQGCAAAQRHRLFGAPLGRAQPQALSAAKAALWAAPKLPEAHLAMALALGASCEERDLRKACSELQRALEFTPEAGHCWAELAANHTRRGEHADAAAALEIATELEPTWLFALNTRANLAMLAGDLANAANSLELATKTYPHHANAMTNLAIVYAVQGNPRAADLQKEAITLATRPEHQELLLRAFEARKIDA